MLKLWNVPRSSVPSAIPGNVHQHTKEAPPVREEAAIAGRDEGTPNDVWNGRVLGVSGRLCRWWLAADPRGEDAERRPAGLVWAFQADDERGGRPASCSHRR